MLSKKKFKVVCWDDEEKKFTSQELMTQIKKDSKTNKNWIASAQELYKTCHEEDFPKDLAESIMILILSCFANLELTYYIPDQSTIKIIQTIYNELGTANAKDARKKFLENFIQASTKYNHVLGEFRFNVCYGSNFKHLESEWIDKKIEEYSALEYFDYNLLKKKLFEEYKIFLAHVKEDDGVKKEMEAYFEEEAEFMRSLAELLKE